MRIRIVLFKMRLDKVPKDLGVTGLASSKAFFLVFSSIRIAIAHSGKQTKSGTPPVPIDQELNRPKPDPLDLVRSLGVSPICQSKNFEPQIASKRR